jgi:hypothetical protein
MSFMFAELPGCFCVAAGSSIGQSGAVAISSKASRCDPIAAGILTTAISRTPCGRSRKAIRRKLAA